MKIRILIITAALLASIWALVPTFAPVVAAPWGAPEPIPLGIDLQGGMHLMFEPELDDAVASAVMRDAGWLMRAARDDQLEIDSIRRTPSDGLEIVSDETPRSVQLFVDDWHGGFRYTGSSEGVHHFELPGAQRQVIQERAFDASVAALERRLDEGCFEHRGFERIHGGYFTVELPGLDWVPYSNCH